MKRKHFSPPYTTTQRKIQATTKEKTTHKSFNYSHDDIVNTTTNYPHGEKEKWAYRLLQECAYAISQKDSTKTHHLLWMLNELASSHGDFDQKLASYFMKALFWKVMESGQRWYKSLVSVAERNYSFGSARNLMLKFQEVSPWITFGHVACNGAILEAFDHGESKLHIIDISNNTLCTQWPTLLEALATRSDQTPSVKLTVVVSTSLARSFMKEIAQRMEKFARLMGIPFEINVIARSNWRLGELSKEEFGVKEDETVVVNCVGGLMRVEVEERGDVIRLFGSLNPRVVTIVEEEADFTSTRSEFIDCFAECLRFYALYFEMLEESFTPASNERLVLERRCSRSIVMVLSCDDEEMNTSVGECERREKGSQWCARLKKQFSPLGFSEDVVDDVNALLRRYRTGWSLAFDQTGSNTDSGMYLAWKEEPVVWASTWKP